MRQRWSERAGESWVSGVPGTSDGNVLFLKGSSGRHDVSVQEAFETLESWKAPRNRIYWRRDGEGEEQKAKPGALKDAST